jgi:hypothetical protein
MKVEILGTGCHNCLILEDLINEVLRDLGRTDVEVIRNSDEHIIRRHMPLDEIPGLLIDGVLASSQEIPSRDTLKEWLSEPK